MKFVSINKNLFKIFQINFSKGIDKFDTID